MRTFKKLGQEGIGLIETLLALGVSIIIVTSMVSLAIFTLRASLQNKLLLTGTQLANQEIELVRAFRDTNLWQDFLDEGDGTNSATNCYPASGGGACHMDNTAIPPIQSGSKTIGSGTEEITKSFTLTDMSGGAKRLIRVAVTISWQIGADPKYAHNYTELSDWGSQ